jgi:hypothetical protein
MTLPTRERGPGQASRLKLPLLSGLCEKLRATIPVLHIFCGSGTISAVEDIYEEISRGGFLSG